jgi:hypothetical protein
VNRDEVATLRALLAPTGWPERARVFARALRTSTKTRGGLLLVGTPEEEPWHLAAHLDDESRLSGIEQLAPTLVRWNAPLNAPPHLRIGLERLEAARRGETLFVVTPETAPSPLLERVSDARRVGATILALNQGDPELDGLAHETLTMETPTAETLTVETPTVETPTAETPTAPPGTASPVSFTLAQHLVSAAAGERVPHPRRGVRQRLAHLLDVVSGPSA